jgi:hypothetical protein
MPEFGPDDLRVAVRSARSWRGVLRELGLPESSSAQLRAIQRQARDLSLDTAHFSGPRTWTDAQLVDAVARAHSWPEVGSMLRLAARGNGSIAGVRRRAAQLALATGHLDGDRSAVSEDRVPQPRADHLHRAGPMLAAAWFSLCGYDVLWPLEPCRYDLGVSQHGRFERVQVKTTTHRADGAVVVSLSTARRRGRVPYSPDEVDQFFVVDDDQNCYLIPVARVAGRYHVHLRRYEAYRVVTAGQLLTQPPPG